MSPEDTGPDFHATGIKCRACEVRELQASADQEDAARHDRRLYGWYWSVARR